MVNKKEKEFMKSFIRLYIQELELFFEKDKKSLKYKEKVRKVESSIQKKLPQYSILFDNDLKVLEKIFRETTKKEKANFIVNDFLSFLKWTIKRLYREKIIDKKVFEMLNSHISKINFNISLPGSVLWKG